MGQGRGARWGRFYGRQRPTPGSPNAKTQIRRPPLEASIPERPTRAQRRGSGGKDSLGRERVRNDVYRVLSRLLLIPTTAVFVGGAVICVCALFYSVGKTTIFWHERQTYRIVGPVVLAIGCALAFVSYILFKKVRTDIDRILITPQGHLLEDAHSDSEATNVDDIYCDCESTQHSPTCDEICEVERTQVDSVKTRPYGQTNLELFNDTSSPSSDVYGALMVDVPTVPAASGDVEIRGGGDRNVARMGRRRPWRKVWHTGRVPFRCVPVCLVCK